jgi:hypothetical protein
MEMRENRKRDNLNYKHRLPLLPLKMTKWFLLTKENLSPKLLDKFKTLSNEMKRVVKMPSIDNGFHKCERE